MLSREEVIHIAKLARLELNEEEIAKMQKDLAEILDYIEMLNKIDTSGINLTESSLKENILREDKTEFSDKADEMLEQAPEKENRHFKVKEILT